MLFKDSRNCFMRKRGAVFELVLAAVRMFTFPTSEPAITIGACILNNVLVCDLPGADAVTCYERVPSAADLPSATSCTAPPWGGGVHPIVTLHFSDSVNTM
jgi:hypothetical protein